MSWLDVLRVECDRSGQATTARKLGISATVVNQVLKGNYKASTDNVQRLVEGTFMGHTVACPVSGEISLLDCLENRKRPYTPANHVLVALFRACPECTVPK